MEPRTNTIEQLFSLLRSHPEPLWLLGAGASIKSGVPLAEGMVVRAAKWEYCRERGSSPDDPRIKRSDYLTWLNLHKEVANTCLCNTGTTLIETDTDRAPTDYARGKNSQEDLSESMMLYLYEPDKFQKASPARFEFCKQLLGDK